MRSPAPRARRQECSLGNSPEHSQLAVRYFAGSDLARLARSQLALLVQGILMVSLLVLVHSQLVVVLVPTLTARAHLPRLAARSLAQLLEVPTRMVAQRSGMRSWLCRGRRRLR
jgi:hypothetical protein